GRQVVDEGGDVDLLHRSAVLGTHLDSVRAGDHQLPSVPGDVVVHPAFQTTQQCRLAMETAPDDQADPFGDAHAGHPATVGQVHFGAQRVRGGEGDDIVVGQGTVVHTAAAGEYGAVADESHQSEIVELVT